jgi:hypothetical protein
MMGRDQLPHSGLPVVPHPQADELLGSWLLRVAQVYGLGLRELLDRLAAMPAGQQDIPRWFELHPRHLRLEHLAAALHRCVDSITPMTAPQCDPRWPVELGFCGRCLDEATAAGAPFPWLRRWMHPMSLACAKHCMWLEAVPTRRLRAVRGVGDLAGLSRSAPKRSRSVLERQSQAALIKGALWLEAIIATPLEHPPPWGRTDPSQLALILRSLIDVLMSPAPAHLVRHQLGRRSGELPARRQRWACRRFRVDDGINGAVLLSAPDCLRHRQFVLGLLGHCLHVAPIDRAPLRELTSLLAREIPARQVARWPPAAAQWVLPLSSRPPPLRSRAVHLLKRQRPKPAPSFGR